MEETKSLICTRCGSHHLEKQSETEYKCLSCDAIITKEKAVNFEKEYRKLLEEGKSVDIANLRYLARKALEGHIDKVLLVDTCTELLRILPEDILSLFYIKYINREKDPFAYESFLKRINSEATQTEVDEIIDIIITNARFREKDEIINIINKFYKGREDKLTELEKALKQRTKEIDLFSDVPRDIFICHSSLDKDKVNEILKMLEEDGNTCWISSRNIPWDSDNYWLNIEKAIKSCNIFLCLNSINTMQSRDCIKEVEIASSLNKKRIEYKLDEARDITLFKNFFTGQWITNTNDLLDKVYDLKHKEETLYEKGLELLKEKKYEKALECFDNLDDYKKSKEYKDVINRILKANKLIDEKLFEEAKTILLEVNEIEYIKDYLILINQMIEKKRTLETNENIEINNKEENTRKDENKKTLEKQNKPKELKKQGERKKEEVCKDKEKIKNGKEDQKKEELGKELEEAIELQKHYVTTKKLVTFTNEQEKEYVYFGSYPQTLKEKNVKILKKLENGNYLGSDGHEYVCQKSRDSYFNNGVSAYFSNQTIIKTNTDYYFKVEPIKWNIEKRENGKVLLVSNNILTSLGFDYTSNSNNYNTSNIKNFLTNAYSPYSFLNIAFTKEEQNFIYEAEIDNSVKSTLKLFNKFTVKNTNSKLFILSALEQKGLKDKIKKTSDYCKVNIYNIFTFTYALRSPDAKEGSILSVNNYGKIESTEVKNNFFGLVVGLWIPEYIPVDNLYETIGFYPQTIKEDNVEIVKDLGNNCFLGDDNNKYMKKRCHYSHIFSTFTNGTNIKDEDYFFKVEPLKFKVISENNGLMLLRCDNIIDEMKFSDDSNNYEKSSVRSWLNNEFLNNFFTDEERERIVALKVDNSSMSVLKKDNKYLCKDTLDKVFLLSETEAKRKEFFASEYISLTDYAKGNGSNNILLRSPSDCNNQEVKYKDTSSPYSIYSGKIESSYGVIPVMWVKSK